MPEVYGPLPCSEIHFFPSHRWKRSARTRLKLRKWWGLLLLFATVSGVQAQEICNNGVDDDGDGYVDCYDVDCAGSFFCAGQLFGGAVPACQFTPAPAPPFQMTLLWATDSIAQPLPSRRTAVIGDIDLDGIPEIISGAPAIPNGTFVFNGLNGLLERTIASSPTALNMGAYAIGDIDNDGFGEVVMVSQNVVGRQLLCYEHNGSLKWTSSVQVGYFPNDESWTPLLADFDENGTSEVYLGNQMFNGSNGTLIATSGPGAVNGAHGSAPNEPFPIAADVLPTAFCPDCDGLELVAGNTVYSVDIGLGTLTPRTSITGFPDGLTSLADVDSDGDIDAVVVAQNASGRGIVYAWDLQTTTQIGNTFQIDAAANAGGFVTPSGGIATVGDLDGNGAMDVVVAGRNVLLALQFNPGPGTFTERWSIATNDNSGRTGTVLFDFEGDGLLEIVHRDDNALNILDATNGNLRFTTTCPSSSRMETPVVADVDNDGQANVICHCNQSVKAYAPAGVPWVSTRGIWNQRSYFVLNIRDNLRIPQEQQRQEVGFPNGSPTNFPFNAFMKQTTRLSNDGTVTYPAANDQVLILNPITDINLAPCQDGLNDSVGVRLTVRNIGGNAPIPIGTPIAFYNGDPYTPGATLIRTYTLASSIPAGGSLTLPFVFMDDQGGTFDLYFQVNDAGTNPIPIAGPANQHQECNYANNMASIPIVNCGNLPPVIDTLGLPTDTILLTTPEDQVVQFCISATDPQLDAHDVTGLVGTVTLGVLAGLGDGDSCVTLTPNPNVSGTSTFSLIVCDNGNVALCDTVVVIWTIFPVNDRPIALDDAATTDEDTPVSIPILLNDTDAEGDPLAPTIIAGPFHGTGFLVSDTIAYTPSPDYFGMDTLYYRVCDNALPPACDTATVVITINPINDPPVAHDDSLSMPNDTLTVTLVVTANDTDLEAGALTVTILCPPTQGSATVSGTNIVYIPDSTYLGPDTLCYVICDAGIPVACDTAYVFLNMFNGNEAPLAVDDYDTTLLEDTVIVAILSNDSDPNGHTFTITQLSCGPNHGTLTLDTLNGTLTYVPAASYLGADTICYVICDNPPAGPPFCDTAMVYIQTISSNIPPVAWIDTVTVPFNIAGTVNILANDSDANPQDSLFATIIQQPANGTVLLSNGLATYTPSPIFSGTDVFCYQLCDNGVPVMCDTACVYVTVLPPVEVVVPNGFSPNGDGVNDYLVVEAIQIFPDNALIIFNRWGSKVFEARGYLNEWDGTYHGEPLPDGTYFYQLDPGDGTAPRTGYIVIYR